METFVNYTTITYLFPKIIQTHKNEKKNLCITISSLVSRKESSFIFTFVLFTKTRPQIFGGRTSKLEFQETWVFFTFLPFLLTIYQESKFFFILLAAQHMYLQQFSMTLESNKFQKSPMHKNAQDCTFSSKYCFTIKISRTFEEKMGYFLH